jgi:hypothetical protein
VDHSRRSSQEGLAGGCSLQGCVGRSEARTQGAFVSLRYGRD